MSNDDAAIDDRPSCVIFGLIIIVGWALFLLVTTQHAEGAPPASFAAYIKGLAGEGQEGVHAAISALSAVLLVGYAGFSARLGLARPAVMTGLVAFAVATAAIMIWTLIDGVVLPGVAARYAAKADADLDALKPIFIFAGAFIGVLFKVRLIATPIAIAAWSIALLGHTLVSRRIGLIGLGAAALLTIPIFVPQPVPGLDMLMLFLAMTGVQALWGALVALQMLRGKI